METTQRSLESEQKANKALLNQKSIVELMHWSDKPQVVATAFTLYANIPGYMTDGLPVGNPESFVRFVEKNPEKAEEIIEQARQQGVLG